MNGTLAWIYLGEKDVLLDENKTESSWLKETDAGCRHIGRCSYVEGNDGSNSRLSYRKLVYRTEGEGGEGISVFAYLLS